MPKTYELIASASPTGGTTVTFSSIPQTYTDLKLIIEGKSNQTGVSYNGMRMTVNNDTSTLYWSQDVYTNAGTSVVVSTGYSNNFLTIADMAQASQSVAAFGEADILDYTSSTKLKTLIYKMAYDQAVVLSAGCYPQTTAITRLDFVRDGSNTFRSGTNIKLYGIKRA
jgi:hypothetical protein